METIDVLLDEAKCAINLCQDLVKLRDIQVEYLGKKGKVSALLKNLGKCDPEVRQKYGQQVNGLKQDLVKLIEQRQVELEKITVAKYIAETTEDITLPGPSVGVGGLHPITLAMQRICNYFKRLDFAVVDGPEIEDEFYNFDALNIPETHPARAMHDTFYLSTNHLLRTHTSPTQIRYMQKSEAPLRMIAPGKVYRCDSDITHTPMFHQVEGLLVDEFVTLGDLKGILTEFLRYYFEIEDLSTRFRASYFPFTEPSAEVDVSCIFCDGQGCRVCSHTGWLEILGCGMVHPHVLRAGNIDPQKYQGFAFGLGVDRMAMLRYQINDLRLMFDNDLRFLQQF